MPYALVMSIVLLMALFVSKAAGSALAIRETGGADAFPLVQDHRAATIVYDNADAAVVVIAARCLGDDVERVAGVRSRVQSDIPSGERSVIVGSIEGSQHIRALVDAGKLDVSDLRGRWESYKFAVVDGALIIVGSDRRGTAYGVFELSRAIGVSPWHWWADVPAKHREQIHVALTGSARVGPPSVKYRGIFLNDEDWGLQPWAAKTFEIETGDIGPKTYARIFELLLRLRANYCWPAMHPSTKAFNFFERNKQIADDYAIVMGSSHCEQMLRNNVDEWDHDTMGDWNPVTNLPAIIDYWDRRVRENGRFENVYTVGMRGIHDGDMPGGGTVDEKRERLEKIINAQRGMLARHVNPDPAAVPQIFCPYKEVLSIYRKGLALPDDITIVWPDDNYGYVRQLPDARERARSGGNGIYYHLSYWGRPHDYLWLESTSPALIWHEMTRAYDAGADRLWVVNVGDLKPAEAGMTLFLELAWNRNRYGPDVQRAFLRDFYREQFGEAAGAIDALKDEYFRLCAIRKPEHMGFNRLDPNTRMRDSDWSADESNRILERWMNMAARAEGMAAQVPEVSRDAYFQLVQYPACTGAAMAEKFIVAEQARQNGSPELAQRAEAAHRRIAQLTDRYNALARGKWRGMMNARPRGLEVFNMPPTTRPSGAGTKPSGSGETIVEFDVAKFARSQERNGIAWRVVEGLGPRGAAIGLFPRKDVPTLRTVAEIREHAPVAEYAVERSEAGEVEVTIEALPTFPRTPAHELLVAISIDERDPVIVRFERGKDDENDPTWQTNVLRGSMMGRAILRAPSGASTLKLWAADAGVVVQHIRMAKRAGT